MKKAKVIITILLVVLIGLAGYYVFNYVKKENSGFKNIFSEKAPVHKYLNNDLSDVKGIVKGEKLVRNFLNKWNIKGASVSIVKDGKLIYTKGFGYADEEKREMVQPYHLFRVASVSKLITAVAIMKMQEEGLLSLNSKVFGEHGVLNDEKYLCYKDKRYEDITIEHLLTHSGGWSMRYGDHMFIPDVIQAEMKCDFPVSIENTIKFALSKRLHFPPGSRSSYSNLGYVILGEVIGKITKMSYEKYVNTHVLNPIGIYDMHLGKNLYSEKFPNEVRYYEQSDAEKVKSIYGNGEDVYKSYGGNNVEILGAAGGWIASSAELAKLLVVIDGFKNVPDILKQTTINEMTRVRKNIDPIGWKETRENGTWWRTGTLAGTSALMKRQPDGISWVFVVNSSSWKGARFPNEINKVMTHMIATIEKWPKYDLFAYKPDKSKPNTNEAGK